jgi:hypothetical protein
MMVGAFGAHSAHAQGFPPPYYDFHGSTVGTFTGYACSQFQFCFSWHGLGFSDTLANQGNLGNGQCSYDGYLSDCNVTDNGVTRIPDVTNGSFGYVTYFRAAVFGDAISGSRSRFYQTFFGRSGSYSGNPGPGGTTEYVFYQPGGFAASPTFTLTVETISEDMVTMSFYDAGPLAGIEFTDYNGGCSEGNIFPCNAV